MSAEFYPNGAIELLIRKYGPNAEEVKEAIEFWGPEAGEFEIGNKSTINESQPTIVGDVPDKD